MFAAPSKGSVGMLKHIRSFFSRFFDELLLFHQNERFMVSRKTNAQLQGLLVPKNLCRWFGEKMMLFDSALSVVKDRVMLVGDVFVGWSKWTSFQAGWQWFGVRQLRAFSMVFLKACARSNDMEEDGLEDMTFLRERFFSKSYKGVYRLTLWLSMDVLLQSMLARAKWWSLTWL